MAMNDRQLRIRECGECGGALNHLDRAGTVACVCDDDPPLEVTGTPEAIDRLNARFNDRHDDRVCVSCGREESGQREKLMPTTDGELVCGESCRAAWSMNRTVRQDDKQDRIDAAFGVNTGASNLRKIAAVTPKYGSQDCPGKCGLHVKDCDCRAMGAEAERARIEAAADKLLAGWYRDTEQGFREAQTIALFLDYLKRKIREGEAPTND